MTARERHREHAQVAPTPRLEPPPLALYVHLPWCVRKCPYCDFNSHAAPELLPQQAYVEALLEDLELDATRVGNRTVVSIFFGGGTPSLFDPDRIGEFLQRARNHVRIAADAEVTLEANPGTIEHGRFADYRAIGINRVSLGAQSFDPAHLRRLGRIHDSHDIARAVDELVRAGIENFNLDLMYGLPEQTVAEAIADIDAAVACAPTHISHYQLTLEPGTVFYHRPPPLPDAETCWDMQLRCQERLARAGYEQYEVSAYARAARRCVHNLNYWRFGDYIGIGAGAHGKITQPASSSIVRVSRVRQPREYLSMPPAHRAQAQDVASEDAAFEYMLNALRLLEGFHVRDFEARTGVSFARIAATVAAARERGLLLEWRPGAYRPTELGQRFLNDLQALFLPASAPQ